MLSFFLDENTAGKIMVEVLRAGGVQFVTSKDLGLLGAADHLWVPQVTELGHVIVTLDRRMRYNPAEKKALEQSRARVLTFKIGKSAKLEMHAQNIVNSQEQILRFARRAQPPWLVNLALPTERELAAGKPGTLGKNKLLT